MQDAARRAAWFKEAYGGALSMLERGDAAGAERELRRIQQSWPGEVNSLRVLGLALQAQGHAAEGIAVLRRAVAAAPDFVHAHVDLARAYRAQGLLQDAVTALRRALSLDSSAHDPWCLLGDLLVNLGEYAQANLAYERFVATDPQLGTLERAGSLLKQGAHRQAEEIFRRILRGDPQHIGALCGLAAISLSAGHSRDGERLLRHALEQSRHMPLIWRGMSQTLSAAGRPLEAETAIRHSLLVDAAAAASWVLLGTILAHTMRQAAALEAYQRALDLEPLQIRVVLSKGHVLKTLGRRAEAEAEYRRCLTLQADFGEAYYSLADLKNYRFDDAEVAAMQRVLAAGHAGAQLHFALGRAFEQRELHDESFAQYRQGNALRRREAPFDVAAFERKSKRVATLFTREFLESRGASSGLARGSLYGCADGDPYGVTYGVPYGVPIFIVGLPRSGSTLVEQVLASHTLVDGTMELPNILTLVRELDHQDGAGDAYPESVRGVPPQRLPELGERYLDETRIFRTARPYFVDKMPNNFSHVGLIHLILPNAIVIDVRRHPLDACWSAYKQYFSQGQAFTYDLEDLGRYYRAYLGLMEHWDAVLPGKVLHVSYEALVNDTEAEVRRLLRHCGLGFEAACLRFYENRRAVRTASSEQVRRPIYHSSVGQWRHVAAHLQPLETALGDALRQYESPP